MKAVKIVTFLLSLLMLHCELPYIRTPYFIIATTSKSEIEAIKFAEALNEKGYKSEVYKTKLQEYAVTLGRHPQFQARRILKRAVEAKIIGEESYLTAGEELEERIYPPADVGYYVAVKATTSREEAINAAAALEKKGYVTEVYQTRTDSFVVTIGNYPREEALALIVKVNQSGQITGKASLTAGISFQEKIYPEKLFLVAKATPHLERALNSADSLVNQGYESEVYWTTKKVYVVVLGKYFPEEAPDVQANAVQAGLADQDSYLTDGKEFVHLLYP